MTIRNSRTIGSAQKCAKQWPQLQVDDLTVACIHCIRGLRHGGEGEVASKEFKIEAANGKEAEANDRFRQLLFDFLETPDS